jgi:hypothetical protein
MGNTACLAPDCFYYVFMSSESIARIVEALRDLPEERQQELLDFVKVLKQGDGSETSVETNGLEDCFGVLSAEEGAQMDKAIEEAFEGILLAMSVG